MESLPAYLAKAPRAMRSIRLRNPFLPEWQTIRPSFFGGWLVAFVAFALLPQICQGQTGQGDALENTGLQGSNRPNILIVLADDLGFSDLGCFGGEIETPNLDRLATAGVRLTQLYNTGRCWPTRASLLTGHYAQAVRRDKVQGVASGARGTRPLWAPLLPTQLQSVGYRCYHSGKWHLDGQPLSNGFHHSYWLQDQGRFFNPKVHFRDDAKLPAIPKKSGFYATNRIAGEAINQLREHANTFPSDPFFLYLAFTAPHFPLQAPEELINKYRDRYQAGWESIRSQRWTRIQEMGLISGTLSLVQPDVGPPYAFPDAIEKLGEGEITRPVPWQALSDEQKAFQTEKMAIHAAMVDAMDQQIGRVLEQLESMRALDNTFILFLSDNGASAEIMVRDDGHSPDARPGSADTYLCLGPGWSTTCNTPFRYHKTWVHEGGIATPGIIHWPNKKLMANSLMHAPVHAIDLWPTVMELAGVPPEVTSPTKPGRSFFRQLASGVPGSSSAGSNPVDANSIETLPQRTLYWSHEGNRAVRFGKWKLVATKDHPWELFDLSVDRSETNDLSAKFPEQVKELEQRWHAQDLRQTNLARDISEQQSEP